MEVENIGLVHNSRVRVKNTLLVPKCVSRSEKDFARIKTGEVDNSVPFNADVLLCLHTVISAIAHHLEVEGIGFVHNSPVRVTNTLWVTTCFSRSEEHFARKKTGKVDN